MGCITSLASALGLYLGVGACTMDVNYHDNWIILWRLIDEMGIYGTDRSDATSPLHRESDSSAASLPNWKRCRRIKCPIRRR